MSTATLITGCSTGFGRDAAERLARRGHTVVATMRDVDGRNRPHREALEALAARERLALTVVELDVTDDASVQRAVADAIDRVGGLDAVDQQRRLRRHRRHRGVHPGAVPSLLRHQRVRRGARQPRRAAAPAGGGSAGCSST